MTRKNLAPKPVMETTTVDQKKARGAAFAAGLGLDENYYPYLRSALQMGLDLDCNPLGTALESIITSNQELSNQWTAFLTALETTLNHLADSENEARTRATEAENLTVITREHLAEANQTIAKKSDLIDGLTVSLLQRGSGGSGRRITEDPEKFTGTEKDITKRQQQYVNWRSQINRCFAVDSTIFNSELRKIQHISGLLKDDAYDFNRENFNSIIENKDEPERWVWRTSEAVFRDLNGQYETLDLSRDASLKFDNLKMGNRPFQNFIAEFNSLSSRCGKTPEQKVESLRLKVSDELAQGLAFVRGKPDKKDFDGWWKFYQGIYDDLQDEKHLAKLRSNKGVTFQPRTQQTPAQPLYYATPAAPTSTQPPPSDPMVLDVARYRPSREECIQKNLCFYCKKPGHSRLDCEEKKRNDIRWVNPQQPTTARQNQQATQLRFAPQPWQRAAQYQRTFPQPLTRLRAVEPGFVEGEVGSETASVTEGTDTAKTGSNQGKV